VECADIVLVEGDLIELSDPAFDAKAFCARWPAKILCSTSGFGAVGPRKGWVGNELVAEVMGGLVSCTGYPERPPVMSGVPFASHVSALFAFGGIMAALWERRRSGLGQWLDLAVVDSVIALLGNFMPFYFLSGRSPKRVGNRHTLTAPWNLYPTADGHVVICTSSVSLSMWERVTRAIERPELGPDPLYSDESKRMQRVDEVDAFVSEWTCRQKTQRVVDLFEQSGVPVSSVMSVEDLLADPQYVHTRAMVGKGDLEVGGRMISVPIVGLPLKIGAWSGPAKAGPSLGEFCLPGDRANTCASEPALTANRTSEHAPLGALSGVRVLEFGARTSAPLAGRLLADLGADVVKIEPLEGDHTRGMGQLVGGSGYLFHINNAGKRSLAIDTKDPRGRELIYQLAAQADIWIENLAPGSLDAMGLGYTALSEVNAQLIYASCSGYGHVSDYGKRKALDTVVQAATGIMHLTGYPDHHYVKIGLSAVDLATAVAVVAAVTGALRQRQLSGEGMHVDLAMADVSVWMTQAAWPEVVYGSGHPERLGNRSRTSCPHNIFDTAQGQLAIATDTDAQWQTLAALLGDSALASDPALANVSGRFAQVERIEQAITAWLSNKTAIEAAALCQAEGVPAGPLRDLAEVVQDPVVSARGLVVEVEHPIAGQMRLLGNPLQLSRTPARVESGAPVLGQHTEEVLSGWLALPEERIQELTAAGLIRATRASQITRA